MTCIVALKSEGRVYMGGDSAAVSPGFIRPRLQPKVFRKGPYLIGYSGSFRMGQLIEHKIVLPEPSGELMHFLCTEFIDAIRNGLKENGSSIVDKNEETNQGSFLVAVNGRMFEIDDDFQVGEYIDNYCAIGCGTDYALGALYALESVEGFDSSELVEQALCAAETFSTGVIRPFHIMEL